MALKKILNIKKMNKFNHLNNLNFFQMKSLIILLTNVIIITRKFYKFKYNNDFM